MEIHKRDEEQEPAVNRKLFLIRQILNIIFMVGALAGAVLYWGSARAHDRHPRHHDSHVLQDGGMCAAVQEMTDKRSRHFLLLLLTQHHPSAYAEKQRLTMLRLFFREK